MELDKKIVQFRVICNDEKYLKSSIDWYNSIYKTDFKIVNFTLGEVNFVDIKVSKYTLSDIFNIGYQFGVKEEKLRQKGEIDW
ncbi:hypothetical protein [Tenacibaculum singaporense]|uniref:hypothetical protein n=1 Tax=Tenacibaculum singaporense TaxID=2358479 RepID=UPI0035111289